MSKSEQRRQLAVNIQCIKDHQARTRKRLADGPFPAQLIACDTDPGAKTHFRDWGVRMTRAGVPFDGPWSIVLSSEGKFMVMRGHATYLPRPFSSVKMPVVVAGKAGG